MTRARSFLGPAAGIALFVLALWVLHEALAHLHYAEIAAAIERLPRARIAAAALLAAAGYAVLAGYDLLGFRFIGRSLPARRIAHAAFTAFAFANNFGHALFTGATLRYWLHAPNGVSAGDAARLALFCSLGFWLGYLFLGALAFTLEPIALPPGLPLVLADTRPLGTAFFALLGLYALLVARGGAHVHLWGWEFRLPSVALTAGQAAVGVLDLALMSATLWVLLPADASLPYLRFLPFFLLALVAGTASQVPGGLGVFESVVLLLLPKDAASAELVAALLAFRVLYYVAPLLIATLLLAVHQARRHGARLHAVSARAARLTGAAVPQLLAGATFAAGAVLLISGALPAAAGRLAWLAHVLPLAVIEASHFLGSLAGAGLLLLARGLQRRLDGAYLLAIVLLAAGIVFSLAKGADYEEAAILAAVLATLAASRAHFHRRASLLAAPLTPGWVASIAMALAGSLWLYVFAFRHAEYAGEAWWQFALDAQAPRALRATVGAVCLAVLLAAARLLRPSPPAFAPGDAADLARARPIIERSAWTYANLALRGDKALLFSASGSAFLMYGRMRRSWIAMGDPVGPEVEAAELAWQFRDLCDRYGGWPVFYQVSRENASVYLDLGLALTKLGEEARVELARFDLAAPQRAKLRQARSRLLRAGCAFAVVPAREVAARLPQLERVSKDWLASKATREKGFSNASFDVAYLRQFPVATVIRGEEVIAFANVWLGGGREELSVDLMRHARDAPNGTMDYLFAELLLWGREQGYRWFNFGMAPLSGLATGANAPLWERFGGLVYQYGEHFYNFRGLRRYKEKFGPVWSPRYLASPGGLALPAVLVDVAALVAGGFAGIVAR